MPNLKVQSAQANLAYAKDQLAQAESSEVDFTEVVKTMWLNAQAERTRILTYLNEVRLPSKQCELVMLLLALVCLWRVGLERL